MKVWAESFYSSRAWKECRESYLVSQHYLCERCNDVAKVVHHKKYLTSNNISDPFVSLAHNNLEALCQDCHNREHHGNKRERIDLGYRFDEAGNIVYAPHGIPRG